MMKPLFTPIVLAALLGGGVATAESESPVTRTAALPSYLVANDLGEELAALQRDGRLTEAEARIDAQLSGTDASPDHPLVVERQRLARVRRDYSQTPDELLAAI